MIKPDQITNFERSDYELQEFLMFTVCVHGKPSHQQATKLDIFLAPHTMLPFEKVRLHGADGVRQNLTACKMGQYTRITNAFMQMANSGLDLRTCTVDELETVHGVGMKSARFFLMHTRPNQQFAVLDTHILKHLKEMGYDVPKRTPTVPSMYRKVEGYFMELVAKSGLTIAEYDLMIWTQKRQNVA